MLLTDTDIKYFAEGGMINPFIEKQVKNKDDGSPVISFGLSSFGYDATLGDKLLCAKNKHTSAIDPKKDVSECFYEISENKGAFIIPPLTMCLGYTKEYFKIPENIFVLCVGKSTYARCGLIVNVTPLEPGWEGNVTLELSNTTRLPIVVYKDEGICQFVFYQGLPPEVSYQDRHGKYMGQKGVTFPRV